MITRRDGLPPFGRVEPPAEDVTDSEWTRLEDMAMDGVRETVRKQSEKALELLDTTRPPLEKP